RRSGLRADPGGKSRRDDSRGSGKTRRTHRAAGNGHARSRQTLRVRACRGTPRPGAVPPCEDAGTHVAAKWWECHVDICKTRFEAGDSLLREGRGGCFKLPLMNPAAVLIIGGLNQPPRLCRLRNGAISLWRSHPSLAKAELSK